MYITYITYIYIYYMFSTLLLNFVVSLIFEEIY